HPRVESLPEEGEPEPEDDPEGEAENAVPLRTRLDLNGLVRALHDVRLRGEQRLHLGELLVAFDEVRVERRVAVTGPGERGEALRDALSRANDRCRVGPAPEARICARGGIRKPQREERVVVLDP